MSGKGKGKGGSSKGGSSGKGGKGGDGKSGKAGGSPAPGPSGGAGGGASNTPPMTSKKSKVAPLPEGILDKQKQGTTGQGKTPPPISQKPAFTPKASKVAAMPEGMLKDASPTTPVQPLPKKSSTPSMKQGTQQQKAQAGGANQQSRPGSSKPKSQKAVVQTAPPAKLPPGATFADSEKAPIKPPPGGIFILPDEPNNKHLTKNPVVLAILAEMKLTPPPYTPIPTKDRPPRPTDFFDRPGWNTANNYRYRHILSPTALPNWESVSDAGMIQFYTHQLQTRFGTNLINYFTKVDTNRVLFTIMVTEWNYLIVDFFVAGRNLTCRAKGCDVCRHCYWCGPYPIITLEMIELSHRATLNRNEDLFKLHRTVTNTQFVLSKTAWEGGANSLPVILHFDNFYGSVDVDWKAGLCPDIQRAKNKKSSRTSIGLADADNTKPPTPKSSQKGTPGTATRTAPQAKTPGTTQKDGTNAGTPTTSKPADGNGQRGGAEDVKKQLFTSPGNKGEVGNTGTPKTPGGISPIQELSPEVEPPSPKATPAKAPPTKPATPTTPVTRKPSSGSQKGKKKSK